MGILVSSGATSSGEIVGNVVSGNDEGMRIASPGWAVRGNLVGWDTDGSTPRGNTGMGIHVDTSGSEDADPVTIGGEGGGDANRVGNNGDYGIALWLNEGDATVEHNEIAANGQAGIFYTGGGSSGAIRANTVAGNTSFGIQALDSSPLIEANEVTENGDAGIMAMWTTGGIGDLTIEGNTSSENQSSGIWLFGAHATVLDNEVEDNLGGGIFVISNPGSDPAAEATEDDVVAKATIGSLEHPNVISGNDGGIMILEALVWNRYRLETENTFTGNTGFAAVEAWFGLARAADAEGEPISGATVRVFAAFQDPDDEEEEPFWEGVSDEEGIAGPDGFSAEDVFTWGVAPSFMLVEDGAGQIQRLTGASHVVRVEGEDPAAYTYPWDGYNKPGCATTSGICRYQIGESLEPYGLDAPVPLSDVVDQAAEVWHQYTAFFSSELSGPVHDGGPGEMRTYWIFSPSQCRGSSSHCPAVIVLHGGGGDGPTENQNSGPAGQTWMDKARAEGFVLIFPNGLSRTWNATHCCGDAFATGANDFNFIVSLVGDLYDGLGIDIDKARIYLAGMSNGAMLAHEVAAARPHCFAAVAAVAGTVGGYDQATQGQNGPPVFPSYYSGHHVPILMIHGEQDEHVNYYGGDTTGFPGLSTRPRYDVSQADSIAFWLTVNDADGDPDEDEYDYFTGRLYPPNSGGAPVYHVTITDPGPTGYSLPYGYAGHAWPGGRCTATIFPTEFCEQGPPLDLGDPPTPPDHFSAIDAIWYFFDTLTSENENFPITSCRCYGPCPY